MSGGFASFVYRNSRPVLLIALVGIAVAGVFGLGVAKRLSPYGDTDPSTQSVRATNRYQAGTGRQIDPGVVALVKTDGLPGAAAERRVRMVEAQRRGGGCGGSRRSCPRAATSPRSPATTTSATRRCSLAMEPRPTSSPTS